MKILAFKGKSWVSRAIRWQTRSIYSHIAVQLGDGTVIEAWSKGGVVHRESFRDGHTPGTKVDVFTINPISNFDEQAAKDYLLAQIGKKYDFGSVLRFLSRRKSKANNKFFCSELAESALLAGGCRLLNGNPSEHAPAHTAMSPLLTRGPEIIA